MKIAAELALKQSLTIGHDMRLAIDMLAMTAMELDDVIDDELEKNPLLEEADTYYAYNEPNVSYADGSSAFDVALNTSAEGVDFRDELVQQIGEGGFRSIEREIAHHIINNLDDDGLLSEHELVYQDIVDELGVFDEWIDAVRKRVMDLEPLGCGAFDSGESLMHQAQHLCTAPHKEFIALLGAIKRDADYKLSFARLSRMKDDHALAELRKLKPRPASRFFEKHVVVDAVVPEISVTMHNNNFLVALTKKPSERLVVASRQDHGRGSFVRDNKKRALFMMKALRYRETSLSTVSKAIVDHQQAWFLNQGPLRPLNLREIADVCGVHESSVSRLTKGKYLFCARGIFELKFFFTNRLVSETFEDRSSSSVKDQIKNIISKEDRQRPLSDQKIVEKLAEGGFSVARRTVTKYRESMDLKAAHQRRAIW